MLVEKVAELGCEQLIDHFWRSLGLHPAWRLSAIDPSCGNVLSSYIGLGSS